MQSNTETIIIIARRIIWLIIGFLKTLHTVYFLCKSLIVNSITGLKSPPLNTSIAVTAIKEQKDSISSENIHEHSRYINDIVIIPINLYVSIIKRYCPIEHEKGVFLKSIIEYIGFDKQLISKNT